MRVQDGACQHGPLVRWVRAYPEILPPSWSPAWLLVQVSSLPRSLHFSPFLPMPHCCVSALRSSVHVFVCPCGVKGQSDERLFIKGCVRAHTLLGRVEEM